MSRRRPIAIVSRYANCVLRSIQPIIASIAKIAMSDPWTALRPLRLIHRAREASGGVRDRTRHRLNFDYIMRVSELGTNLRLIAALGMDFNEDVGQKQNWVIAWFKKVKLATLAVHHYK